MSDINKFSLKNFRNFKNETTFEFSDISIITGPNSSGKSSLTKAILLLKENLSTGLLSKNLICTNSVQSLGSFGNIINIYSGQNSIEFKFSTYPYFGNKLFTRHSLFNVSLKYQSTPILPIPRMKGISRNKFDTPGLFDECIITDSDNNLIFKLRNNHVADIDTGDEYYVTLNTDILFNVFYDQTKDNENSKTLFNYEFLVPPKDLEMSTEMLRQIERKVFQAHFTDCLCYISEFDEYEELLGLEGGDVFEGLIPEIEQMIVSENIALVSKDINYYTFYGLIYDQYKELLESTTFNSIFYIPAERANLNRIYGQDKENLLEDILEKIKYKKWYLSHEFIEEWLQKFEIGDSLEIDSTETNIYRIYIHNGMNKTLVADLGYGVTQLLPIILMAALRSPDPLFKNTIIIEEPELNLHPKLQSLIADMIVESMTNFQKRFIIETHSEYLIRKLQYLVGSDKLKADKVCIYYLSAAFNKDENPVIKRIKINDDGSLNDIFGKGFFDEAIHWQLELLHLKNKN